MKEAWVINLEERPDKLREFQTNVFPFSVRRFEAIPHEIGWKGCVQSHIEVLSLITQLPAVVFEDDAEVVRPWSDVEEAIKELPDRWDLLQLGMYGIKKTYPYSKHLRRVEQGFSTHAIIYNSWCVVNAIIRGWDNYEKKLCKRGRAAIDGYYFDIIYPMFKCFVVYPYPVIQRPGFSDIEQKHRSFIQTKWS